MVNDAENFTGTEVIYGNKIFNLKAMNRFLNDIFSGKIDNIYTAEKEFLEKIKEDGDLLRNYKQFAKDVNAQTLASIIDDLKHAIFGVLLPSEQKSCKQQSDTTEMPELEDEQEAAQRQTWQGLKILTPKQMILSY